MPAAVARRYAMALFELALEQGKVELVDEQAQFLEDLFRDHQVRAFFQSPRIPAEQKKRLIASQLSELLDPVVHNLLKLLIDKRRIGLLAEIMREFDELTDRHRGVEEVTIVSAVPLTEQQRAAIIGGQRQLEHAQRFTQALVAGGLAGLTLDGADLAPDLAQHVRDAQQVLLGRLDLRFGFAAARFWGRFALVFALLRAAALDFAFLGLGISRFPSGMRGC